MPGCSGVLCVGRVYCDLIFSGLSKLPVLGEEQFASALSLHAGGGAYITAAYLAALDQRVSLLATLPAGPFAAVIQQQLQQSRIGTEHCHCAQGADDPQITVAMTMNEERAFLTRRSGTALPVERIDWSQLRGFSHLHIGELASLAEHPQLITDAHAAGISVSVDCGWDDEVFKRTDLAELLRHVDVFLPNQDEYDQLLQRGVHASDVTLCVIKQGQVGAAVVFEGSTITSPAHAVEVIDTTGAGDAFNAGFIHGWLQQQPLQHCLALGNTCGAKAVASVGGAVNLDDWDHRNSSLSMVEN